jgi:hypothetical protein
VRLADSVVEHIIAAAEQFLQGVTATLVLLESRNDDSLRGGKTWFAANRIEERQGLCCVLQLGKNFAVCTL